MRPSKTADMKGRISEGLAKLLAAELHYQCPEESMNRHIIDLSAKLTGCVFEDGLIKVSVTHKNREMVLSLKPIGWERKETNA